MEVKTPFITKLTTIWVTILTITIVVLLVTEDISRQETIIIGTALLACLIFFAGILIKLGTAERKKQIFYKIKL